MQIAIFILCNFGGVSIGSRLGLSFPQQKSCLFIVCLCLGSYVFVVDTHTHTFHQLPEGSCQVQILTWKASQKRDTMRSFGLCVCVRPTGGFLEFTLHQGSQAPVWQENGTNTPILFLLMPCIRCVEDRTRESRGFLILF